MKPAAVETWVWVLLYGGLLVLSLGAFALERQAGVGWALVVVGALAAAAGIVLIFVRARMSTAPTPKQDRR